MPVIAHRGWEHDGGTLAVTATTATYSDNSLTFICPALKHKSMIIKETGGAHTMTYRVRYRVLKDGVQYTYKTDTLAAGGEDMIAMNDYCYDIEIAVISGDGVAAGTIDYGGRM